MGVSPMIESTDGRRRRHAFCALAFSENIFFSFYSSWFKKKCHRTETRRQFHHLLRWLNESPQPVSGAKVGMEIPWKGRKSPRT